jgi:hypothetical protein
MKGLAAENDPCEFQRPSVEMKGLAAENDPCDVYLCQFLGSKPILNFFRCASISIYYAPLRRPARPAAADVKNWKFPNF